MDGLSLLTEARAAGLSVAAEAGRLVIRGPKRADGVGAEAACRQAATLAALSLERIRNMIEDARRSRPRGVYGDSLARVLGDFWQIALAYSRQGLLPSCANELETCIRDFARNAHELATRPPDETEQDT
jgi:hypothetical protein